ncbi:MAG: restriction endonuclease subunit S [Anaerolineae bacterium]|nr:restriction endonuclease subunit S [Anaerolineae bacterium]
MTKLNIPHPDDWPSKALSKQCEFISRGYAPSYVDQSNVLAIGQRCVQLRGFDASSARPHDANRMDLVLIAKPHDVLLNSTGTGTIGRSCVFEENRLFVVDGHVTVLRLNDDAEGTDSSWLNFLIQSPCFQRHLELHCYTGSTNQIELSRSQLEFTEIWLPKPKEQRAISAILEAVESAIHYTEQLIAKLKQVRAGLLHDLLTFGIDYNGELRNPERHSEQFKMSELGTIPSKWDISSLALKKGENRPHIKTGPFGSTLKGEHWVNEGVPVVTIGSLGEGSFIHSELLFITEQKAQSLAPYCLEPGDLVFSRVADVGRSVVVSEQEAGWIMSSNLMRLALDSSKVLPIYLYLNLAFNHKTRQQIRKYVNAGGREVANTPILDSLKFAWPPLDEQFRIVQMAQSHSSTMDSQEEYLAKLYLLKQSLVDSLFTGAIRVTSLLGDANKVEDGNEAKTHRIE